jgi:diguanylate cyclase (GGDEF)-like protein
LNTLPRKIILIVDDMVTNIEILGGILNDEYEVLFATSGRDALEIAQQQFPDLILLDVIMPDMDGYQVCHELKLNERTKDIPVIFVTANDQEEDESKGFEAGVVDYITKPVSPSIVKARVRIHLELKGHRDYLKVLSTIDGLTRIANRRKFDEALEMEWKRSRRNQAPLSLIMLDIDFFKNFNDHYGHIAGDECLRQLARGISEVCKRPADLFARYGGEEFVILLPETDFTGACMVAKMVQNKIEALRIPHGYSEAAEYVTMSIGAVTLVARDDATQYDFINGADGMLYAAKQNGRNQIKARDLTAKTTFS